MEVPGLADSLQQCLCVNSGIYAGNVLDTDPGWQQSKLIWALSAEVGSASRMHCTGLWRVKAAQQPFCVFYIPSPSPRSKRALGYLAIVSEFAPLDVSACVPVGVCGGEGMGAVCEKLLRGVRRCEPVSV